MKEEYQNYFKNNLPLHKGISVVWTWHFFLPIFFPQPYFSCPLSAPATHAHIIYSFDRNHFLISFLGLIWVQISMDKEWIRTSLFKKCLSLLLFRIYLNPFFPINGYTKHFSSVLNSVSYLILLQNLSISLWNLRPLFALRAQKWRMVFSPLVSGGCSSSCNY